jgi:hypothetical protein
MSSEEASTETMGARVVPVFRVKLCVWRAKEISDYFRVIDRTGESTWIRGRTGAKSSPRVKSTMHGRSPAPGDLPRKMYDPEWLSKQERERPLYVKDDLRISEEAFHLLVLATANV